MGALLSGHGVQYDLHGREVKPGLAGFYLPSTKNVATCDNMCQNVASMCQVLSSHNIYINLCILENHLCNESGRSMMAPPRAWKQYPGRQGSILVSPYKVY